MTARERPGSTKITETDIPETDESQLPGRRWVTMSNALTRAGHGLTLAEKRIVAWAISTLDSKKKFPPGEVPSTKIMATDFAKEFDIEPHTAYEQLQNAARQLHKRSITFYEPVYKRGKKDLPPTMVSMSWVGQVHYQKGEGWVELFWWNKIIPHLTGLKKHFTSYQLQQASALRSIYSWRLLELLTRYEATGWAEYSIEDFKASMNAPPSLTDFGQVKRRILIPAIKELTEKDGWLIEWHPIKKGKRVAGIRFTFKRNPQLQLFDAL